MNCSLFNFKSILVIIWLNVLHILSMGFEECATKLELDMHRDREGRMCEIIHEGGMMDRDYQHPPSGMNY